jgi:hypothetical protein
MVSGPEQSSAQHENSSNPSTSQPNFEVSEDGNLQGEGRPIPVPYVLCKFPADIQLLLDSGDKALAMHSSYRNKIRKAVCDDMAQYTL